MCRHHFARREWRRRESRNVEALFTIVMTLLREAIAVLARTRRELQELLTPPAAMPTGHELKPRETHPNVPL
jgi:hypothetical protein